MEWELERFFSGGSASEGYRECIEALERDFGVMRERLEGTLFDSEPLIEHFLALITDLQAFMLRFQELAAFQYCLANSDLSDDAAKRLGGRIVRLESGKSELLVLFEQVLCKLSEEDWRTVSQHPDVEPVVFPLTQMRHGAQTKLAMEQEVLAGDLAEDGFHAWQEIYRTLVSNISVPFESNGQVRSLTLAQVNSLLPTLDPTARQALHQQLTQRIAQDEELFASALNHLTGYRLAWYKHRGWDSVLQAALHENRISEQTLEAMLAAIDSNRAHLITYLQRKAELLGQTALHTFDITVPVQRSNAKLLYDKAVSLLIEHHRRVSPQMAVFLQRAIEEGWVDAAERPHKRGGGFCVRFPLTNESRVFLTYTGRYQDLACLAHELGHAYHQSHTMRVPALAQETPLTLGETASTFSEQVVLEAALQAADSVEEKVALLDAKLSLTILFLFGFEFRFRFEKELYVRRQQGVMSAEQLYALMEQMQQHSFAGSLAGYQAHAWATYPLFYQTGTPFYNFPYLFGFLFSKSIYALASEQPESFADRYDAFLQDTGRMTVEELAEKHLGEDITQQAFWERALATCIRDVEAFLQITDAG